MADDSIEIVDPLDCHPCDSPRGMLYYNRDVLTDEQQTKLNKLKINTIREDEKYLASHPEVRAIVSIITRLVLKRRPRENIYEVVARYFTRPRSDIEEDINAYIRAREPHVYQGDSAVVIREEEEEEEEEEVYVGVPSLAKIDEEFLEEASYEQLSEIIDTALEELHIGLEAKAIVSESTGFFFQTAKDINSEIRQLIEEEILKKVGRSISEEMLELIEREILAKIGRSSLDVHTSFAEFVSNEMDGLLDTLEPEMSELEETKSQMESDAENINVGDNEEKVSSETAVDADVQQPVVSATVDGADAEDALPDQHIEEVKEDQPTEILPTIAEEKEEKNE